MQIDGFNLLYNLLCVFVSGILEIKKIFNKLKITTWFDKLFFNNELYISRKEKLLSNSGIVNPPL
jgi:hypothetical protein